MSEPSRRRLAWALWVVTILAYVVEVALLFANADLPVADAADAVDPWLQAMEDLAFVAVGTLGLRIVLSQPRNAVGWWIMTAGLAFPLEGLTAEFSRFGIDRWGSIPIVALTSWISLWVWILGSFNIPFLLLLYPDGHAPSARWKPALWLTVGLVATTFIASALYAEPEPVIGLLPNPLGIPALTGFFDMLFAYVIVPGLLVTIILGFLSLIARYRNGAGVVRQQVKVLMWVGAVAVIFFGVTSRLQGGAVWLDSLLNIVFSLFVGGAVTLAILRYRLFEIDRLISRTVTYSVLAGALALVYGVGAVWLPSRIVGEQTPLFVAGSTLAVAALFNPLRRRVMRWVERRFNRSSYDLEQITEGLAARLRDQVDADWLANDWATVVNKALQPSALGVW
ncbi:MAG: hypothetical protein ACRDXF_00235, partial [Acidimicrobiia bacterium]